MEMKVWNFGIGSHDRIKRREACKKFGQSLKAISKLAKHLIRISVVFPCCLHSLAVIQMLFNKCISKEQIWWVI